MRKLNVKTLAKYENQYIALSLDSAKILASGKTIKELEKKLQKLRLKEATLQYISPLDKFLSPVCQ